MVQNVLEGCLEEHESLNLASYCNKELINDTFIQYLFKLIIRSGHHNRKIDYIIDNYLRFIPDHCFTKDLYFILTEQFESNAYEL